MKPLLHGIKIVSCGLGALIAMMWIMILLGVPGETIGQILTVTAAGGIWRWIVVAQKKDGKKQTPPNGPPTTVQMTPKTVRLEKRE